MAIRYRLGATRPGDLFPPLQATFPPAYRDGAGKMTVSVSYDDTNRNNGPLSATRAFYKGTVRVDGQTVFEFDDIGIPIRQGRAVDTHAAYKEAISAAIAFGSTYKGSGHGAVCNPNPKAAEYDTVWQLASMEIERDIERSQKQQQKREASAPAYGF